MREGEGLNERIKTKKEENDKKERGDESDQWEREELKDKISVKAKSEKWIKY